MQTIEEALEAYGNDSIQNLFDFVAINQEAFDKDKDPIGWFESSRTAIEVGLAIYRYASSKEKICHESTS